MIAECSGAFSAEVAKNIDGAFHFAFGFRKCFPFFPRHFLAELLQTAFQKLRCLKKKFTAQGRRLRRPAGLSLHRRLTSRLDILGSRSLKQPDSLPRVRRIDVGEGLLAFGFHPPAVDIILKGLPFKIISTAGGWNPNASRPSPTSIRRTRGRLSGCFRLRDPRMSRRLVRRR